VLRAWRSIVLLAVLPSRLFGQSDRLVFQLPLRLVDLAILAGTTRGVQVVAAAGVATDLGERNSPLIWLRFHPDSLVEWVNRAATAIHSVSSQGPSTAIQWAPMLQGRRGGTLALGREREDGKLQAKHWLVISDSITGWKADVEAAEADSLLRLLFVAATQARLDTIGTKRVEPDSVDSPVTIIQQPAPSWRGSLGRVVAEYVVDEKGRADPNTFVALLASSFKLVEEARAVILNSRFRPAMRAGHPVRQLVQQAVLWRPQRVWP